MKNYKVLSPVMCAGAVCEVGHIVYESQFAKGEIDALLEKAVIEAVIEAVSDAKPDTVKK